MHSIHSLDLEWFHQRCIPVVVEASHSLDSPWPYRWVPMVVRRRVFFFSGAKVESIKQKSPSIQRSGFFDDLLPGKVWFFMGFSSLASFKLQAMRHLSLQCRRNATGKVGEDEEPFLREQKRMVVDTKGLKKTCYFHTFFLLVSFRSVPFQGKGQHRPRLCQQEEQQQYQQQQETRRTQKSHNGSNHHPSESPFLRAVEPLTSENPRKAGRSIDQWRSLRVHHVCHMVTAHDFPFPNGDIFIHFQVPWYLPLLSLCHFPLF